MRFVVESESFCTLPLGVFSGQVTRISVNLGFKRAYFLLFLLHLLGHPEDLLLDVDPLDSATVFNFLRRYASLALARSVLLKCDFVRLTLAF